MVKEGDKFRDGATGTIFRVIMLSDDLIVLESEEGCNEILLRRTDSKSVVQNEH